MRFFRETRGAMLATGLVCAMSCVFSGCDAGGSQSNGVKPINPNILKKLGNATQNQQETAKEDAQAKIQAKGLTKGKNKKG